MCCMFFSLELFCCGWLVHKRPTWSGSSQHLISQMDRWRRANPYAPFSSFTVRGPWCEVTIYVQAGALLGILGPLTRAQPGSLNVIHVVVQGPCPAHGLWSHSALPIWQPCMIGFWWLDFLCVECFKSSKWLVEHWAYKKEGSHAPSSCSTWLVLSPHLANSFRARSSDDSWLELQID